MLLRNQFQTLAVSVIPDAESLGVVLVNEVGAYFLFETRRLRNQRRYPVRLLGLRCAHPRLVALDEAAVLPGKRNRYPGNSKANE